MMRRCLTALARPTVSLLVAAALTSGPTSLATAQTSPAAADDPEGSRLLAILKGQLEGEYAVFGINYATKVSGSPCFTRTERIDLRPLMSKTPQPTNRLWENFDTAAVNANSKNVIELKSSFKTSTGITYSVNRLELDTPERAAGASGTINALIEHCKGRRKQLDAAKRR
ncbi:MAG: hypothetical protein MUF47_02270 [Porphyrobacter sp.]|jgi:hypothetical protein|nr:hypothetical protein [Porphyrobacter sp.]